MASYLGTLAAPVLRLLTPDTIQPFVWAFAAIGFVFFLPYVWRGTAVGYAFGVIGGILGVAGHGGGLPQVANGTLPVASLFIFIPGIVLALLLIGSSILAWREG